MSWDNWDDVQLTDEQIIEAASKGAAEAQHAAVVRAQTNTVPVDRLDTLSDDALLAEWEKEAAKIEEAAREKQAFENARLFCAEEPRFVESEWNAQRVDTYVKAKYGDDHVPSVDQLHEVFDALASKGLLQVRELPRSPRPVMTDSQLEAMPIEELEALAREEERQPGRYRRTR